MIMVYELFLIGVAWGKKSYVSGLKRYYILKESPSIQME